MPTPPTAAQIRQQFLDFFQDQAAHTIVPSAPVVPHDDPTLLFTNAGMNQFKDVFLGTGSREYHRAADTQKCIRAGGKHNDLDDVGRDTYHHTFFEMLGNWSFGDYFKTEAINFAFDLLTKTWGLDPKKLYATYFEGAPEQNLEPDHEARDLWLKILPADQVLPGNMKDNFWEMGDTGPCGPCSELHYNGTDIDNVADLVNMDDPNVIEIWNLVFIQYNRNQDKSLTPLPAKHVDTGMGFERIVRVIQNKDSNYDTDVFTPLFTAIQKITGARAYTPGGHPEALADPTNVAYRVIADHIRTLTFSLADGAHCTNEGRGYVLRSILRRAVRYGRQSLNTTEPFFYKLVETVVENFADTFPEIKQHQQAVADEIRDEEESFSRTLDRGIALFDQAADRSADTNTISAKDAFQLHDTFGFPIGLTRLMAQERAMNVDETGFESLMEAARIKSRGQSTGADAKASLNDILQQNPLPATQFEGYTQTSLKAQPTKLHLFKLNNDIYSPVDSAQTSDAVAIVTETTPFYAEAGGQVGDTGSINTSDAAIAIHDTIKVGDVIFHLGTLTSGSIAPGQVTADLIVNPTRRALITNNHTTTHLMNRALRDAVNPDTAQKGSLVDDEKLRFDFSQNTALTNDQLTEVETLVNADIAADLQVNYQTAPQEDALKIQGLRAVFGEKYPPNVRVVAIGASVESLLADPSSENWSNLSIEFCGGVHLPTTGAAQAFTIITEEGVAKGVRRITALTGEPAQAAITLGSELTQQIASLQSIDDPTELAEAVKSSATFINDATLPAVIKSQLRDSIATLQSKLKKLAKQADQASQGDATEAARKIADSATSNVIIAAVEGADASSLRSAMDVIKSKCPDAAMLLAAASDDKIAFLAAVPKPLIAQGLKAGDWIREVAKAAGGGGGGRPDMAQAGGKDPAKLQEALQTAQQFADKTLG